MRRAICIPLVLCALAIFQTQAHAANMKASAPEKMLPADQARKMRACDLRAMKEKIPMEQHADFVKKCMAEMK